MKKLLLMAGLLLMAVGVHAEDYYDLEHYQIVPDTTTNTNDIRFRGDFKLYDSTHIADFDSLTPTVIFYATGTVVCPRIETQEFVAVSTETWLSVGDKLGFDGDYDSNDYLTAEQNNEVIAYVGGSKSLEFYGDGIGLTSGDRLWFDERGDTYFQESASDRLIAVVGGVTMMQMREDINHIEFNSTDLSIEPTQKFYLDDGSDTYITEPVSDRIYMYAGGVNMVRIMEDLNTIEFNFADVSIQQGKKLYLDSGVDTYLVSGSGGSGQYISVYCDNVVPIQFLPQKIIVAKSIAQGSAAGAALDIGDNTNWFDNIHADDFINHSLEEAEDTETAAKDLLYAISIEDKSSYPTDVFIEADIATEDVYKTIFSTYSELMSDPTGYYEIITSTDFVQTGYLITEATGYYEVIIDSGVETQGDFIQTGTIELVVDLLTGNELTSEATGYYENIESQGEFVQTGTIEYEVIHTTATEVLGWTAGEKIGSDGISFKQLFVYLIEAAKEFKIGDDASQDQAQIVFDLSGLVVECFELIDSMSVEMSSMAATIDQYELEIASNTARIEALEQ